MSEDEMLQELFMDLLNQGCGNYNKERQVHEYDHLCISTYERALKLAIDFGWIKESQLTRSL